MDDDYEEECEHPFFEIDWEGRAHCDHCSETWWASADEIRAQVDHEASYAQFLAEEQRWPYRLKQWFRHWVWLLRYRWSTRHWSKLSDDEIPF